MQGSKEEQDGGYMLGEHVEVQVPKVMAPGSEEAGKDHRPVHHDPRTELERRYGKDGDALGV